MIISEKERNSMICKVNRYLHKQYKTHPTIIAYEGGLLEGNHQTRYLKSLSASCVNYLLYGRCVISPEMVWEYINWETRDYETPTFYYKGIFAFDPDDEENMIDLAGVIAKGLYDEDKMKFADDAKQIVKIMSEFHENY